MTLIIVILLLLGYVVIATGHLTGVNKAAIAIFIGTVGWVVCILILCRTCCEHRDVPVGDDEYCGDSEQ